MDPPNGAATGRSFLRPRNTRSKSAKAGEVVLTAKMISRNDHRREVKRLRHIELVSPLQRIHRTVANSVVIRAPLGVVSRIESGIDPFHRLNRDILRQERMHRQKEAIIRKILSNIYKCGHLTERVHTCICSAR